MSDYIEKLRPQVERVKAMLESPDLKADDKVTMRKCAAASIEESAERQEITNQQRDELMKLLYPFDLEIFPDGRP